MAEHMGGRREERGGGRGGADAQAFIDLTDATDEDEPQITEQNQQRLEQDRQRLERRCNRRLRQQQLDQRVRNHNAVESKGEEVEDREREVAEEDVAATVAAAAVKEEEERKLVQEEAKAVSQAEEKARLVTAASKATEEEEKEERKQQKAEEEAVVRLAAEKKERTRVVEEEKKKVRPAEEARLDNDDNDNDDDDEGTGTGTIFDSPTAATTNDDDDDNGDNLPPVPTSPPSQPQPQPPPQLQPQPQSYPIMNSNIDSITQEVSALTITVANQADTAAAAAAAATATAQQQVQATATMAAAQQASSTGARNDSVQEQRQQQVPTSSLMRVFNEAEQEIIRDAIYGYGPDEEIVAQFGTDSVQRASMQTLKPGKWLNDEIIHHFYFMLSKRDDELCKQDHTRQRSHFFKSFFMTKLLNEGNASCEGTYEYRNVKGWSKKVPGKDLFKLDKILFPINVKKKHWMTAVIFMKQKCIEMFDSKGSNGRRYLEALLQYLQDEHLDKKKVPLPDVDDWKLIPTQQKTPRQHDLNEDDCGVFTCMFAEFLSKDKALVFTQDHMDHCRKLIALSIMKKAIV